MLFLMITIINHLEEKLDSLVSKDTRDRYLFRFFLYIPFRIVFWAQVSQRKFPKRKVITFDNLIDTFINLCKILEDLFSIREKVFFLFLQFCNKLGI